MSYNKYQLTKTFCFETQKRRDNSQEPIKITNNFESHFKNRTFLSSNSISHQMAIPLPPSYKSNENSHSSPSEPINLLNISEKVSRCVFTHQYAKHNAIPYTPEKVLINRPKNHLIRYKSMSVSTLHKSLYCPPAPNTNKKHIYIPNAPSKHKLNTCKSKLSCLRHPLLANKVYNESISFAFKCNVCGKSFANTGTLHNHKLRHEGVKRFSCIHCSMAFIFRSGLQRHMRTHTNIKNWQCAVCHKYFREKSNLKIHNRIHTGEKPYKCIFCNKSFTQSAGLKCHNNSRAHIFNKNGGFQNHLVRISDKNYLEDHLSNTSSNFIVSPPSIHDFKQNNSNNNSINDSKLSEYIDFLNNFDVDDNYNMSKELKSLFKFSSLVSSDNSINIKRLNNKNEKGDIL